VSLRMDARIAARVDPSDVVQETLTKAAQNLADYLQRRPLPFYPWLRHLAWERLIHVQRQHVAAQSRSVTREEPRLSDASARQLAGRVMGSAADPGERMEREEVHEQLRSALAAISARDREIVIMRFLEQLSTGEVAAILGMSVRNVQIRQLRAMRRLRELLRERSGETPP